jgi:ADP-heptose:LPS heptosyltransferase
MRSLGRFLAGLRARRFDLAIDLQGLLRSGLMTAATGAPVRVGLARAREGATIFYTHRIADAPGRPHAVDRLLSLAAAFGADDSRPRFVVALNDTHRDWARAALAHVPRPRIVVNVGARWLTKRWPPEHFAAVARRAATEFGAGLVAVGSNEDRPLIDALRAALDGLPVLDLGGRTTLPLLAAVAAESDLFLSNDTGPLHLAAATGTRAIGVYTCTRPEWTGPYGPNTAVARTGIWCAGRCLKTCKRLECMDELTPRRVWLAVAGALGQSPGSPHLMARGLPR